MSLLEWFSENYFPGEVGTIEKRSRVLRNVPRYRVLINIIISLAVIAGLFTWNMQMNSGGSFQGYLVMSGAIIIYCIIGFYINPKPDYNNIGIGNTPINHPLRISDNINRFLVVLKVLIWPGLFIARSFIEFYTLLKHSGAKDMR